MVGQRVTDKDMCSKYRWSLNLWVREFSPLCVRSWKVQYRARGIERKQLGREAL